jgi:hypothetical protein
MPLLWHSAQQLDNLSPDIISQGHRRLELSEDSEERQKVANTIEEIVSSHEGVSSSSKVTVYYTSSNFVIKSIPEERDGYGRLAPILSYGNFPNEEMSPDTETAWIKEVSDEVLSFSQAIPLTLSEDTQELIKDSLRKAIEDIRQKKILKDMWKELKAFGLTFGAVILAPIVLGRVIYEQIPQILNPLVQQNLQKVFLINLQEILQTLVLILTGFLTVNNAILVLILKLPSLVTIRHYYKMRKMRTSGSKL